MAAPTADLKTTKRPNKDGKIARRSMGFWCQFNCWYRTFWEAEGRRPSVTEVKRWYDEAADSCWGDMKPTWDETRTHSKCLRSLDQVRSYFRQYRAAKKESSDGCKADASMRHAGGSDEALQRSLYAASLFVAGQQDDAALDADFFRAPKMRRPSADSDTGEGAQLSGYTSGDLASSNSASPGQDRMVLARLPGVVALAAYGAAVASGVHTACAARAGPCAGASSRTISTGAVAKGGSTHASASGGMGNNAMRMVCSEDAYARRIAPFTAGDAMSLPIPATATGATAVWLQPSPDLPPSGSQQLAGSSSQRQQAPLSSCQPLAQPQAHRYPAAALQPPVGSGSVAPSLPPGILRPGMSDTPTDSPHRADRPPRPPPHASAAGPAFAARISAHPGTNSLPVHQQAGSRGPGYSVTAAARVGCAVSLAPATAGPASDRQQQPVHPQQHANAYGQVQSAEVTTDWGQQQQQQPRVPSAKATAAPAAAVGMSAYPHHRQPTHHPMMHVGYDSVYGHPAYLDPYAYSYGMHDASVAYWQMYPYCYSAPSQHPSHALYPELAPHMPDYRDPCYGVMAMPGVSQCAQQNAAEAVPAPVPHFPGQHSSARPLCASALGHSGSGALRHGCDSGTSYELARSHSVPLPQHQPDTVAYPPRPASFCGAGPPPSFLHSDLPAAPATAAAGGMSQQFPTVRSADLEKAPTSINMGGAPAAVPPQFPGRAARPDTESSTNAAAVSQRDPVAAALSDGAVPDVGVAGGPTSSAEGAAFPASRQETCGAADACPVPNVGRAPLDICDVAAVVRVPPSRGDNKADADMGLSPFACGAHYGRDLGLGFGFESPGFFISVSTPHHAPHQQQARSLLQKHLLLDEEMPASRGHTGGADAADAFAASVLTPGAPSLASGLDMLPLPDLLALGSDLDIDCALFLTSPPTVAMAATGCGATGCEANIF